MIKSCIVSVIMLVVFIVIIYLTHNNVNFSTVGLILSHLVT